MVATREEDNNVLHYIQYTYYSTQTVFTNKTTFSLSILFVYSLSKKELFSFKNI